MDSSMSRAKAEISPVAGVKRPAPVSSLLPAFEPRSSSPCLPPPFKRHASASQVNYGEDQQKYPTPIPTSSTGIFSSSPPPLTRTRRAGLRRTFSTRSERAPLSDLPTIELKEIGEAVLMGRSSNSSHHQLSANPHISRIHVQATYVPPDPPRPSRVEVLCLGWNGMRVHCQGKRYEVGKNERFSSEDHQASIMIDVQDTRVLLQWPQNTKKASGINSTSPLDDENSTRQSPNASLRHQSPNSSPLRPRSGLQSPASLRGGVSSNNTTQSQPTLNPVHVYEDEESEVEGRNCKGSGATQSTQQVSQNYAAGLELSQSDALSEPDDFSDENEENDPIIHSFGPFGDNLLSRMASFPASNSQALRRTSEPVPRSSASLEHAGECKLIDENEANEVVNHAINQLAFSRLSSTPLSTILSHLPARSQDYSTTSMACETISAATLKKLLDDARCIGEVTREGKDAAGKALESEYYYVPDLDVDEKRREAVVGELRKPGLRTCRKQHKQYFWRKPK
ncbi:hypothetical protein MMC06_003805 [Schaereria dolodes]|nr:hypothetical protein [Schaereria dolodes]